MGGGGAFLAWPPQLPVHSSQRKFIILFKNMCLEIGMDPMLKLFQEFINQTGFAVQESIPAWRAGTATLFVVPARQTT
jgi:hypothetical protein